MSIWKSAIKASIPYTTTQLEKFRLKLLREMKTKTFSHYTKQMENIRKHIEEIMLDDKAVNDDNHWEKANVNPSFAKPYWESESPWINKKGEFPKKTLKGGVTGITKFIFTKPVVNQLIGEAYWMTPQQIMLFKTIVSTYFSQDERLYPIGLNMDYVFGTRMKSAREDTKETPEQEEERINKNKELLKKYKEEYDAWEKTKMIDPQMPPPPYPVLDIRSGQEPGAIDTLLKSALAGAGPFVLKVLQQINTSNNSKIESGRGSMKVAELTGDIFSNIPGLSPEEAKLVEEGLVSTRDPSIIRNMNPEQLGSASIAEAHLSRSDRYDLDVVIKFIKPMYAYYFMCEVNFLFTTAWKAVRTFSKGMNNEKNLILQGRRLLMFFVKEFMKEFDYKGEFVNTTIGYETYNEPRGLLKSIVAIDYSTNPFPCLVLQKVNGLPVDKIMKKVRTDDPETRTQVLSRLYKSVDHLIQKWFEVTLWGSGFFHADLHPGNIMQTSDGRFLFLIDFGSCGRLSKSQQCGLIRAMKKSADFYALKPKGNPQKYSGQEWDKKHAYNIESGKRFVEEIWNLCKVPSEARSEKNKDLIVKKLLNYEYGLYFSTMFLTVAEWSESVGICITSDILMFGRGVAYIGNMIYQIHLECKSKECPLWVVNPVILRNMIRHPVHSARCLYESEPQPMLTISKSTSKKSPIPVQEIELSP